MMVVFQLTSVYFLLLLYVVAAAPLSTSNTTNTEYLKLPLLHKRTHHHHHHHHHHHYQSSFKSPVISGASSGSGEYLVSLELGSPPQPLLLVADTGSDLIWVKCSACRNCSLHPPGSAFLARHSTSFAPLHCFQPTCRHLVSHPHPNPCNHTNLHSPCRYQYSYSDGSLTAGFFSKETITFNSTSDHQLQLQGFHFGCGFRSIASETFNGAHGVMGLGRGPISFPSQLGRRFGNKFSYCLMDYTLSPPPTSFLLIGSQQNDVVPTKQNISFTPLLINPLSPTFYYIGIKSVYVDDVKLRIDPSIWSIDESGNGGTIVDSGTTLTLLAAPAYREILTAFKKRVRLPSPDESIQGFDLCVNTSGALKPSYPRLSFELVGKKNKKVLFRPPQRNYFIETSEEVECLAIQPVELGSGFSVIGNVMQQGYLLEFDKDRSRLGFSRHGCALPLP